uniref:Phosphodiesterase 4B n=1 Tax=Canis lupus familiaris TaxID=9615 RepID=A0A8I3PYW8_CANLF
MKKSRSVMAVTADDNVKDYLECSLSKSYSSSSNTLGIDLWRGRRCCSGNLQLPPLAQRQSERARTPEGDGISRPTTLPLMTLPSIAITTVSQECICSIQAKPTAVIFMETIQWFPSNQVSCGFLGYKQRHNSCGQLQKHRRKPSF